jgi:hypothetical protein
VVQQTHTQCSEVCVRVCIGVRPTRKKSLCTMSNRLENIVMRKYSVTYRHAKELVAQAKREISLETPDYATVLEEACRTILQRLRQAEQEAKENEKEMSESEDPSESSTLPPDESESSDCTNSQQPPYRRDRRSLRALSTVDRKQQQRIVSITNAFDTNITSKLSSAIAPRHSLEPPNQTSGTTGTTIVVVVDTGLVRQTLAPSLPPLPITDTEPPSTLQPLASKATHAAPARHCSSRDHDAMGLLLLHSEHPDCSPPEPSSGSRRSVVGTSRKKGGRKDPNDNNTDYIKKSGSTAVACSSRQEAMVKHYHNTADKSISRHRVHRATSPDPPSSSSPDNDQKVRSSPETKRRSSSRPKQPRASSRGRAAQGKYTAATVLFTSNCGGSGGHGSGEDGDKDQDRLSRIAASDGSGGPYHDSNEPVTTDQVPTTTTTTSRAGEAPSDNMALSNATDLVSSPRRTAVTNKAVLTNTTKPGMFPFTPTKTKRRTLVPVSDAAVRQAAVTALTLNPSNATVIASHPAEATPCRLRVRISPQKQPRPAIVPAEAAMLAAPLLLDHLDATKSAELPPPPPLQKSPTKPHLRSTSRGRGLDQHLQEGNSSSSHSRRDVVHQEPRSDRAPTPPFHPVSPKPLSEFISHGPNASVVSAEVTTMLPCSDVATVTTHKTSATESSHSGSSSGSVSRSPSKLVMAPVVRRNTSTSTSQSTSSSQVPLLQTRPSLHSMNSMDETTTMTEKPLLRNLASLGGAALNAYDMATVSDQPPAPAHRYASPTHTSKRKLTKVVNPFDPNTADLKFRESDTISGTSLTEDCTVSTAKDDEYDDDNTDVCTSPLQRQIQSCYGDFCQYTSPIRRIASIVPMASPRSATSVRTPRLDKTMATLHDSQATLVPNVDWVLCTDDAWKSLPSPRVPRRQRSILQVPPPILLSPKSPSTNTTATSRPRRHNSKKDNATLRDSLDSLPNLDGSSTTTPRKSKHKVSKREARVMSVV